MHVCAVILRRQPTGACSLEQVPCIAHTDPVIPVVKTRRLWARLSTHVPTEPAVTGGEHTAVGFSSAGVLLWLSPWQVGNSHVKMHRRNMQTAQPSWRHLEWGSLACMCTQADAASHLLGNTARCHLKRMHALFPHFLCCVHASLQVKLLLAAVDQLATDWLAMSGSLRKRAGGAGATTADVMRVAAQAAGAAAAQMAIEHGQESGSSAAAASKAATVLLEAAGVVAPGAQLQELQPSSAAGDGQPAVLQPRQHGGGSSSSQHPRAGRPAAADSQQQQRQQEEEEQRHAATRAKEAGRVAAELSSMQILVVLPSVELLCFADVANGSSASMAGSSQGHR